MSGPNATVTRTNVLAGPGQLWIGSYGTVTLPPDADVDVAVNLSPTASAGWADAGATNDGLVVTVNQSFFTKQVDQVADSMGEVLTERSITATTSMAEGTLENLAYALNRATSYITTGSGYRKLELSAGQSAMIPDEHVVIIDGWAPGTNTRRRCMLRRVVSIENVESGYLKDGLYLVPVTFKALYVDSTTSPVAWVDEVAV